MNNTKIGIMGGTFNPVHKAHISLALAAHRSAGLDRVIWIPNNIAYLKDCSLLVSTQDRYRMVELAISDYPFFEISDIEIKRGGNSYTYETLTELGELYPDSELFFITGADTIFTIESWVKPGMVFERATILAAYREGRSEEDFSEKIACLKDRFRARIELIPMEASDISSTMVRDLIKRGADLSSYLPQKVIDYIEERGLYKTEGQSY